MNNTDSNVDNYISNAEAFARPILLHIRKVVHEAYPDIIETIKWGMPHFEHNGIVCHMAAFKKHCILGFKNADLMKDPYNLLEQIGKTAMGHLGQVKEVAELPSEDVLKEYILEAVEINVKGKSKTTPVKSASKKEIEVPDYITEALKPHDKAFEVFNNFSYSHKKEYVEWILEAKTEATKEKRIATMIEWLAEGKSKNWKYMK
jgi:uncharacterized protein YdeI (YjbR/CyaY-like superfamily)